MIGATIATSWYRRHYGPVRQHTSIASASISEYDLSNLLIARGSADDLAPFAWPSRSPDFKTPDNALWGFIKDKV
ncbi:hypothetical protein ANN_14414 [Periplaneta americana]|uniref:Uncharacterized protein n=1 Tax=Periplaneta americana TaxID=6978 RepID=A0ABQ8SXB7_PERAM|nr:hypothetical protein ANN_14414 [Periplaneta americana]